MKDYRKQSYSRGKTNFLPQFQGFFRWLHRVVRTRYNKLSPRTVWLLLLAIFLGGTLACQVVWQHVQVSHLKHQISALQQKRMRLLDDIRTERTKVARLQRLDRISHLAIHELGMRPDLETKIVEVKRTRRVELPFPNPPDGMNP